MKTRNAAYIRRKKAMRNFFNFTDLRSMLSAGLALSRSIVVKKDIVKTMAELNSRFAAA
jgi:hypothetical protein